jgi:cell division protein FtsA
MAKQSKDFICGLDIGTYKICLSCGRIDASRKVDLLASCLVPTQGMSAGRIVDLRKLSASITEARMKLRQVHGIKAKRVYANIDSLDLKARLFPQRVAFNQKTQITKTQIEQLLDSTICSNMPLNRKIIHVESSYPEGLTGREIKVDIVIVSALIPTINSFSKCIRDAGLILEGLTCSSLAQAQGLFRHFTEDEEAHSILIDIGAGLTKIALLRGSLVKDIIILALGAQSITEDIAVKLKVSNHCAEFLKINYGSAIQEEKYRRQKVIVKDNLSHKIVQAKQLNEIVASKVDNLLEQIQRALLRLNYNDKKVARIIVTGGGAILEGFLERAEKILEKPVQMGFLHAVNDSKIQAKSALYATSIGLIHSGFKKKDPHSNFYVRKKNIPLAQIFKRAKRLYQEYFD